MKKFNLMNITNRLSNSLQKGFKLQANKGIPVDPTKFEIIDYLTNALFSKINVAVHFKVLTDPNVFAKNEIYMNEKLIKQFLVALEVK